MGTEANAAAGFFCTKVAADTGAGGLVGLVADRVFEDAAPLGVDFPLIVFSLSSPHDVRPAGIERVLTNATYLVRAIGREGGGYVGSQAEAVAARLDDVIHGTSGGTVQMCLRDRPFSRSYTLDGVTYYERGGYYTLHIHGG